MKKSILLFIGLVSALIMFAQTPIANAGSDTVFCGNTGTLNAIPSIGTGLWTTTLPEYVIISEPNNPNTEVISAVTTIGNLTDPDIKFIWTEINGVEIDSDTITVIFAKIPDANAGVDQPVCGDEFQLGAVFDITETFDYTPSGWWSVYSQPIPSAVANIQPLDNDAAICTVLHYGIYQFVFRENNSNFLMCYDTDTVQIEFLEIPIVSAGEDKDVCGTCITLQGTSGGFMGSWLTNGSAYDDYFDPQTYVCQSIYGPVTYTWRESNQAQTDFMFSCVSHDDVVITYYRIPTAYIFTDDADSTTCGLTFTRLRAVNPGSGISGYWYTNNPGVIFGDEFSNNTSVTVPNYGYYDFYWIAESGPVYTPDLCTDTAGPLRIHFIETPNANAGEDNTLICGFAGNLNAIPSVGTGVWSTPSAANITFEDQNDPNTLITSNIINIGNLAHPYFDLIWSEDNTNGCTDADTIEVVFARGSNSEINIIPPKCFGEPATIAAREDSLQQYLWNFYGGIIESTSINVVGGAFENLVYWNSTDTLHRISLIATDYWGCQSSLTVDTVYEPPIPIFDVTIISDTCMLGKGGIIFGDTLCNNSFFWLDTVYGPPAGSSIKTVYNLPTGEYDIITSYQTPNMSHYAYYLDVFQAANCIDTVAFSIPSFGIIDAQIEVSVVVDLNNLTTENAQVIFLNLTEFEETEAYICEWNFDDGNTLSDCMIMLEHIYTQADCYEPYLIVMKSNMPECRDTAFITPCINVVDKSGINEDYFSTLDFSIFPNPAKESFSVLCDAPELIEISVIDINGKIAINISNYQGEEINIKNLISGIYFVKIQSLQTTVCKKLFVE